MTLSAPTFGELLRQLRRRVGLTQGELALIVGFSVAQISRLEKDERLPDVPMVIEKFLPALVLDEEPRLAQRLLELAAAARGERPPTLVVAKREVRTVVEETIVESNSHLPTTLLPLIGRDEDLAVVSKRLLEAPGRILTLIGPPGVGKTQLAITVAAKVQPLFLDGVHFVPLAAVTEVEHVPAAILAGIGITDSAQKAPQVKLIESLRRQSALLVLDNFEQVSAAAPLIAHLVGECPGIRVLVTSQEPLRLRTEQRQRVQPLAPAAAVELFFQRAQAIDPDFDTIGQGAIVTAICLRLDCLPLAIELLAAQLELFSPSRLLHRLQDHQLDLLADGPRDLPAHQRTLRNAIHRSYVLLGVEEQQLFRVLGVFPGGCTVDAVAAVLPSATLAADAAQALLLRLRALARKSLVQQLATERGETHSAGEGPERFRLLTTLSAYAIEQLQMAGEESDCRHRHAIYYLALAQKREQAMNSAAQKRWLDRLTLEHDNLRAALAWSLEHEPTVALQLTAALVEFWTLRGHDYEARQWIDQVLTANPSATAPRAAVLAAAGNFARRQAAYEIAQRYMDESVALNEALHDQRGLAVARREAGWLAYDLHQKEATITHFTDSLALYRQLDDKAGIANLALCLVHVLRNDTERLAEVQSYLTESLTLLRALDDETEGLFWALQQQGELALYIGNYAVAEQHFREIAAHWRQLDAKLNLAWALALVAEAMVLQDNLLTAESCYVEAHAIFCELGNKDGEAIACYHRGEIARRQGDFAAATRLYQESITLCQPLQNRHITARCLAGLGGVALATKRTTVAATLLGAAQHLFDELAPFLPPAAQAAYEGLLAATRQSLGEDAYTTHWQAGYTMTPIDAVTLALSPFADCIS